MAIEATQLRDLSPTERNQVIALLAALLLEASGATERENSDDRN